MYSDSQFQLSVGQMSNAKRINRVQKSQRQFGELSCMLISVSIRQSANHLCSDRFGSVGQSERVKQRKKVERGKER